METALRASMVRGAVFHITSRRRIPMEKHRVGREGGDELDCPLYLSGHQAGILHVTLEGRDTRFTVRAAVSKGLYRLYARGEKGDLLLGVWEGGAMSRCFSRELTAPAGRILSGVAYSVDGSGEAWIPAAAELFPGWPVCGGLCRRYKSGWQLAMPFEENGPFPLPSLFCLARIVQVMERQCAVFWFDGVGRPIIPPLF